MESQHYYVKKGSLVYICLRFPSGTANDSSKIVTQPEEKLPWEAVILISKN